MFVRTVVVCLAGVQTGRVIGGCVSDRLRVPSAVPVRELRDRIMVPAGVLAEVAGRHVASVREFCRGFESKTLESATELSNANRSQAVQPSYRAIACCFSSGDIFSMA